MTAKKPKGGGSSRRRKKDTKAETVETRKPSDGQRPLFSEDKLLHHVNNLTGWEKKLDDMKALVKKQYEVAAADGIPKNAIKTAFEMRDGDPVVYRRKLEEQGVIARAIGAPYQLNVFDTMFESDVDQAKAEARIAARQSRGPECRFAEGSAAHQAFLEEYHKVQSELVPGADKLTDEQRESAVKEGQAEAKGKPQFEIVH